MSLFLPDEGYVSDDRIPPTSQLSPAMSSWLSGCLLAPVSPTHSLPPPFLHLLTFRCFSVWLPQAYLCIDQGIPFSFFF